MRGRQTGWRRIVAAGGMVLAMLAGTAPVQGEEAAPQRGIALYGEPKYGPDFKHFDYVDPAAPRGGTVTLAAIGSFDNLHPYTIRGVAAAGIGNIYDTLMTGSADEPFSQYPLLAETIEVPEDRSWVAFTLRPQARFHDGRPVTVADVIFTFKALTGNHPSYRAYYASVASVEPAGERRVKFTFKPGDNRELPMILGQLPVLPAHYWAARDFKATTLEPSPGSGPYRVAAVNPGRSIAYERVADYWGKDLPVNVGRHNFDRMVYEYYLDTTAALQAFQGGHYDFRQENVAKTWATGYDFAAVKDGRVKLEEIPNRLPAGMQGFVFNTRRAIFADPRVRWGLAHAFDFEWTNENLFYGSYKRTRSYFENSELAARGLPSAEELAILEPLRGSIPEEVFLKEYQPPVTTGANGLRRNLLEARRLLEEAGWVVKDNRRVNAATGQPLAFEILLTGANFERVALPYVRNLERLGIKVDVRTVDSAQYENRVRDFDFDMVIHVWGQSLSPGNEQRNFWGSEAVDAPGSENLAGIRSPAIDRLIDRVIQAGDRDSLFTRVRALDRVLLWSHYVIPQWYSGVFRVASWKRLAHPPTLPPYGLAFDTWWIAER